MNSIQKKDAINAFLSINDARTFIEVAMSHYLEQNMPLWFINWLDELNWAVITLDEIATLSFLFTDNVWSSPALATNQVYKLFDRLKRDTTGMVDH